MKKATVELEELSDGWFVRITTDEMVSDGEGGMERREIDRCSGFENSAVALGWSSTVLSSHYRAKAAV